MMKLNQMLQDLVQYFTEAFARVFGPSDDQYPNVGVQPFEGEILVKNTEE
ncbi:hypothetical protein IQE94_05925 [Synechocystis sp. PCC 7339]|nr:MULTISPECIES: hypothetical protein [unclassified Synechocystis]QUS59229.1 hypothetical protein HTZ78_13725 [Synechocystis sp. PCC 7338]UAJ74551.1 hypothetical protein IQE94_05925 [Synechocystis sp. PCC 7339]